MQKIALKVLYLEISNCCIMIDNKCTVLKKYFSSFTQPENEFVICTVFLSKMIMP